MILYNYYVLLYPVFYEVIFLEIKTKKLRIVPLSIEQMAILCESQEKLDLELKLTPCNIVPDEHMKAAYKEMYTLCLEHPKEYLWYTNWLIILKDENKAIGSIGFKGPVNDKFEVEIGYGIDEPYQNHGYATEVTKLMCDWAFSQNVYYVQAQAEPDNEASKKVLNKNKFKHIGNGNEGLSYELEKPKTSWISIYMCLGLSIGLCFGTAFDNLAMGMCIGIALGISLGSSLDVADKKKRKHD